MRFVWQVAIGVEVPLAYAVAVYPLIEAPAIDTPPYSTRTVERTPVTAASSEGAVARGRSEIDTEAAPAPAAFTARTRTGVVT